MENNPNIDSTADQVPATPLLVDGKGLAAMLSIGLSLVYQMDRSGRLGPMGLRLGMCTALKPRSWTYASSRDSSCPNPFFMGCIV